MVSVLFSNEVRVHTNFSCFPMTFNVPFYAQFSVLAQ